MRIRDAAHCGLTASTCRTLFRWHARRCRRALLYYHGMSSKFLIVMRGYDMRQVDEVAQLADAALSSTDKEERHTAITRLRSSKFRVKFRGYSRPQVDNYIEHRILELSLPN
jgi:hypothetical protein